MAGASRGLELVTPEVVDGVARECAPLAGFAALTRRAAGAARGGSCDRIERGPARRRRRHRRSGAAVPRPGDHPRHGSTDASRCATRRLAAFLAWLVPGLGHVYQGRVGKGILYAVCILSLYALGFAMGEGKIVYWRWVNPLNNPEKFCLYYLGQFFVGLPALPALIQGTLQYFGHEPILGGFMAVPDAERAQRAAPAGSASSSRSARCTRPSPAC